MTKTLRSCKHCGKPLPDPAARFHVSGDTEPGGVTGTFCSVKHYLAERYGPDKVEEAYRSAFMPVPRIFQGFKERGHADADTLQPEEKIIGGR